MIDNQKKTAEGCQRSRCPVSCILEIIGDKWTLLVIRDLFLGRHTFKSLQTSPEKIPTNILSERLKRLETTGLIRRELYQERPKRYAYYLTEKGQDLGPVMVSMMKWSNKYIPDTLSLDEVMKMIAASEAASAATAEDKQ